LRFLDKQINSRQNVPLDNSITVEENSKQELYNVRALIVNTGCGKLTSFFEYEMPYEKGS
jgi:hypothetical protein